MRSLVTRRAVVGTVVVVGVLIGTTIFGSTAMAQTTAPLTNAPVAPARTIAVTGTSTVTVAPDTAYFSAGVTITDADVTNAQNMTNTKTGAIIDALRQGGVDVTKDAKTSGYSIQPQYNYPQNGSPMLTGYRVTNSVNVTVRDISRVGALLSAVTQAGANQVGGVTFGLADPEAVSTMAREQAVANARTRAETLAKASNVAISGVMTIDDQSSTPAPRSAAYAAPAGASGSAVAAAPVAPPIQTGETSVTATVRVTYSIA